MRLFRLFLFLTMCSILGACRSEILSTTPPPSTIAVSSPQVPFSIAQKTNTLQPTDTLEPTQTPMLTPAEAVLNLPDWMKDTAQSILMYRMLGTDGFKNREPAVHFLNPDTGEKFTFGMPDAYMCWYDISHAVFVHGSNDDSEPNYLFVLDLTNGSLKRYSESDPQFKTYYFDTWICDSHPNNPAIKSDYRVKIDSNLAEWTAFIPDPETGERQYLTSQNDGIFDLDAITSPKHGYTVITQTTDLSSSYGSGNRISIFNLIERKLITEIQADSISGFRFRDEDNFIYEQGWNAFCLFNIPSQEKKCLQAPEGIFDGGAALSQNGQYLVALQSNNIEDARSMLETWGNRISILDLGKFEEVMAFQETDIHDLQFIDGSLSFLYIRQRKTPCIFDITTLTKKCINQITTRFPNDTIELDKIAENPQSLIFFHWGGEEGRTGGLCFFTLYTGDLNCPMEGLAFLNKQVVTEYEFSPDEKNILFTYEDDGCPICDWAGNAGLAVVSRDGKNSYDLGPSHSPHWGGIPAVALWRPLTQPGVNP